jgi:CDP-6-deoxy-D-xylo-4-hexulose-3-dehydrase
MAVAQSSHYGGGEWMRRFERLFADYMGARFCVLVNSGSSANLLALAALELPKGSEIITPAVGFPTTVAAIVQQGHIPVFVDVDPLTLTARWPARVTGIAAGIVAHTLGNPSIVPGYSIPEYPGISRNLPKLTETYRNIPFIEDCCDAVGSTIGGRMVGRAGVMATASFYPAHHITMGEGGAVLTDNPRLKQRLESYRDWGRACWCMPGKDNTCGTRFAGAYDHKYSYDRLGYNLKATDFQASVGVAQLDRLSGFVEKRRENWEYLRAGLRGLPIAVVEAAHDTRPSWFGFAFITTERNKLAQYLDGKGVGNRPIMGGNLLRQPAFRDVEHRVIGSLDGANQIHEQGLWVGCFPGLTREMLDYTIATIREYFA